MWRKVALRVVENWRQGRTNDTFFPRSECTNNSCRDKRNFISRGCALINNKRLCWASADEEKFIFAVEQNFRSLKFSRFRHVANVRDFFPPYHFVDFSSPALLMQVCFEINSFARVTVAVWECEATCCGAIKTMDGVERSRLLLAENNAFWERNWLSFDQINKKNNLCIFCYY